MQREEERDSRAARAREDAQDARDVRDADAERMRVVPIVFCTECSQHMERDTSSGAIVFRCNCGFEMEGGDEHRLLAWESFSGVAQLEYRLVEAGADGPENKKVRGRCTACKRTVLSMMQTGDMKMVWVCACGQKMFMPPESLDGS